MCLLLVLSLFWGLLGSFCWRRLFKLGRQLAMGWFRWVRLGFGPLLAWMLGLYTPGRWLLMKLLSRLIKHNWIELLRRNLGERLWLQRLPLRNQYNPNCKSIDLIYFLYCLFPQQILLIHYLLPTQLYHQYTIQFIHFLALYKSLII